MLVSVILSYLKQTNKQKEKVCGLQCTISKLVKLKVEYT